MKNKKKNVITGFCLVRTDIGRPSTLNGRFLFQDEKSLSEIIDLANSRETIGLVTIEYYTDKD